MLGAGQHHPRALGARLVVRDPPIGPGSVSMLTGDLLVSADDVTVAGMGVSRTLTTLKPSTGGVFGPGWTASLPSDGMADYKFEDHSADGYVLLLGSEGETLSYTVGSDGKTYTGVSDADDGSTILKDSATQYTLHRHRRHQTVYAKVNGVWNVVSVDGTGAEDTTVYTIDSSGRVSRVLSPGRDRRHLHVVAGRRLPGDGRHVRHGDDGDQLGPWRLRGADQQADLHRVRPGELGHEVRGGRAVPVRLDGPPARRVDPRISTPLKTLYTYDSADGSPPSPRPASPGGR
jgi:hypothetical protein